MAFPPPTEKQAKILWTSITALAVGILLALIAALLLGVAWVANTLSAVLIPLAIAGIVAYLLDPFLARTASGFASQLMLSATTSFRFNEPMVHLLSKSDVLSEDDVETIRAWAADAMALENDILGAEPGMSTELATNIARLLGDMGVDQTLVSSSSADGTGMDDLYALVQAAVGQAEEGTPEYDTFLGPEDDDIQV